MAHRKAASVLPDPVGAMTRVLSPWPIARHACAWAWVGTAKAPSNHARVAVEKPSSAAALLTGSALFTESALLPAIPPVCLARPTFPSVGGEPGRAVRSSAGGRRGSAHRAGQLPARGPHLAHHRP